jgi:hypothetical protein
MVMPNTYAGFDLMKFRNYMESLRTTGYITTWWNYLPGGLYFFESALEVNQLYSLFVHHMPNRHFIIMEVNPQNQQGWLIQEAWDWFKNYRQ